MFPTPGSPDDIISRSKKSDTNIFNKRARKAHYNRKSVSEADFSNLYEKSNFALDTSCRTHGHKLDTDSSSKRSSFSSLHTIEEERPLKCFPKSFMASNRRISNIVFHRPKKWASSVLKGGSKSNRKSVSEPDFSNMYRDQLHCYRPFPDLKVRLLERQRNFCSSEPRFSVCSETSMVTQPRRSWSVDQCQNLIMPELFLQESNVSLYEKSSSQKLEHAKLEILNSKLSECKKDIDEFKSKFYAFKEEVHDGINKLYVQIKQDEERYSNLCYRIDHITDLHQAQMRYFESVIPDSQKQYNKSIDTFLFDMLCDQINGIDKRISNLSK